MFSFILIWKVAHYISLKKSMYRLYKLFVYLCWMKIERWMEILHYFVICFLFAWVLTQFKNRHQIRFFMQNKLFINCMISKLVLGVFICSFIHCLSSYENTCSSLGNTGKCKNIEVWDAFKGYFFLKSINQISMECK